MAEAQFIPADSNFAQDFWQSAQAGQNFMERRRRMQWETEDRSRQEEMRRMTEPVYRAQLAAQKATAESTLSTFTQQQELKRRFALEAPKANAEYQAAMELPTFEEQEKALAKIQPKYTWMSLLEEGKPFVDTLNQSRAMAFKSAVADTEIKAKSELAKVQYAQELEKLGIQNQGRIDLEKERQKRPVRYPAGSIQGLYDAREDAQAEGNTEFVALIDAAIAKKNAIRPPTNLNVQVDYKKLLEEQLGTGGESPNTTPSTPAPINQPKQPQPVPATGNVFEGIKF